MRNRNTLPLLSRAVPSRSTSPVPSSPFEIYTVTSPQPPPNPNPIPIPAIRLVQATPSPDSSIADTAADISQPAAILAPKGLPSPRKKLVPKKSKLSLLTSRATGTSSSTSVREKDLSDVVRRVGQGQEWGTEQDGTCNVTVNGGTARSVKGLGIGKNKAKGNNHSSRSTIDIYVDPADDPDIGEIVVVKKKKSRAALEGIRWALGEVTNAGVGNEVKEETEKVKIKMEEKEKWWSIGRGKRDSKEREKEKGKDTGKIKLRTKVPSASVVPTQVNLAPSTVIPRPRNHSLDSSLMLSPASSNLHAPEDCFSAHPGTQSHYAHLQPQTQFQPLSQAPPQGQSRPRFGSTPGLLQPPASGHASGFSLDALDTERYTNANLGGGSLAVRAMRSVKSLARIGSWAQLKNMPAPGPGVHDGVGSVESTVPGVGTGTRNSNGLGGVEKVEKPKKKKDKDKENDRDRKTAFGKRLKSSSSSWEVGALSSGSVGGNGDGGEDTTRSGHGFGVFGGTSAGTCSSPGAMGVGTGLGHGLPSHLQHQHQNNTQAHRDSGGTLLSVMTGTESYRSVSTSNLPSTASGLVPGVVGRRISGCSSSGGSRPGSTYTASGEDTGGFGSMVRDREKEKGRGKVSIRWGGVVVGGERGSTKDRAKEEGKVKGERGSGKEEGKREKRERKEREKQEKKEKKEEKEKRLSLRTLEGRRRTPITSVFPGLSGRAFGRGEDEREDAHSAPTPKAFANAHTYKDLYAHDAEYTLDAQDAETDDLDLEDDEEACVRIAVHTSIPPFLVRERREVRVSSENQQPIASSPQRQDIDPDPLHPTVDQEHNAIQHSPPPSARLRPRPMSEQLLRSFKPRPKGIVESIGDFGESGNGREILTLSVLEAANSDLASLINRLDLEATPDSKASRPASFAIMDPTTSTRLTLGDSESPACGGVDDSPLKMAGARTRASVTSLRPYSFTQSGLRGKISGDNTMLRGVGSSNNVIVGRAAIPPVPPLLGQPIVPWANLIPKEDDQAWRPLKYTGAAVKSAFPTLRRQGRFDMDVHVSPVMEEDSVQPLRPPKYPHQRMGVTNGNGNAPPIGSAVPRIRTSSSELRARAAPFMRTPSVSSTFGSSLVTLNKTTHAHTPSPNNAAAPSSHTFGASRSGPTRYALPSVTSGSSSPRSVMTAGNDTPTPSPRPQRGGGIGGHVRQGSSLVPFVKRVVQSIEAREALENKQQQRLDVRLKKRSVARVVAGNTLVAAGDVPNEGLGAEARRELGFKGTMGVADDDIAQPLDEEDEDSDIPDELQIILSQSDDTRTSRIRNFPPDAVDGTLSFIPSAESNAPKSVLSSRLPPSPGLPPAAPLPTPSSTPSFIHSPSLEPSPPAPTFLPFLEPSPSPSPSLDLAPPIATEALMLTVRPVSEDGANEADVDEPYLASSGSEDDTKQSFDFTGELQRLNESGGAHRRSFVEQLENAFKTPSKLGAEALEFELGDILSVGVVGPSAKHECGVHKEGDKLDEEPDISMMVQSLNESLNLLRPQASITSKPSYGRLDTAFKFGGKLRPQSDTDSKLDNSIARELPGVAALSTSSSPMPQHPLALPPRRTRASSTSMVEEDSSVLRSIYAHIAQNTDNVGHRTQPSLTLESDTSSKRRIRQSHIPTHARSSSDTSFSGMSSFGAVRTKFEFGPQRPAYFDPTFELSTSHVRQESMFSIASMSSYGEVINHGSQDPFNYEQDASLDRDGVGSINEVMSTFDENRRRKRVSADSDISSFYFRAPSQHVTQHRTEHGRNQSVVSTNSISAPPISLYNRSFGHQRSDSAGSANSIANAYGMHGASGGRAAWIRHKQDVSVDSVMSDFSAMRLGRPGVGDKMFESAADHGPLTSISASPPESVAGDLAQKSSYDSILDEDRRSTVDSIFDNTGQRSSISSDSVFGYDTNDAVHRNLFPPAHLRPLSIISIGNPGTPHEDDTMISMLGGGHVRRQSIGSSFEASPCVRVEKREKRKHPNFAHHPYGSIKSPNNARLIHRESVASSTSSKFKFGETRMTLAQQGLLHRNSLEDSCLSAGGEEDLTMHSIRSPVFTRPAPSARPRSRPVVTISQPPDTTPPLSSSEGSQSGGSQSSIDIARLKVLLQTASASTTCSSSRARGHGHRRRTSQISRSSVIGTIHEENPGLSNSPSPRNHSARNSFQSVSSAPPSPREPEMSAAPSVDVVEWDDEQMVLGLRKYYALRSEADDTITHSRIVWPDTAFSIHALQTFTPPDHPSGMQALLEHSQKSYVSLPSDLRPRRMRSRTSSMNRPSPYPRSAHHSLSPSRSSTKSRRSSANLSASVSTSSSEKSRALQSIPVSHNISSPPPTLATLAPFSPLTLDLGRSEESINMTINQAPPPSVIKPAIRPRVGSAARRNALGWTKRRTPKAKGTVTEGKSLNANKENEAHGLLTSPPESLRIVRPRPRSRVIPTPAPRSTSLLV